MPETPDRSPQFVQVLRDAMRDAEPEMNIQDLCRETRRTRGQLGPLLRGETKRMDPSVVNDVAKALGIRVEVLLNAAGFDVRLTPMRQIPDEFLQDWEHLSPAGKKIVRGLAHEIATALKEGRAVGQQ